MKSLKNDFVTFIRAVVYLCIYFLSLDMFYMGCLCILILSLTDQIMKQDKKNPRFKGCVSITI